MRTKQEVKETGATFTPLGLANYLAEIISEKLINRDDIHILDPSCGDGALLKAIAESKLLKGKKLNLYGFDSDQNYLDDAKLELSNVNAKITLKQGDFLQMVNLEDKSELDLFNFQESFKYDVIIANPPYVRTQILGAEKAQQIASKFGLSGRVDLYYPFLIGMTHMLKEGGIIGVLTSNRYLTTKSGESIRKFLSSNYNILNVIDLGDTKLFDAAVLPAIFLGERKSNTSTNSKITSSFTKIYEDLNESRPDQIGSDIYEVLKSNENGCYFIDGKNYNLSKGTLIYDVGSKELWKMLTNKENEWIKKIEKSSMGKIKDYFKVRVGVKTTADSVFIKENWQELGDNCPESDVLKTLISQNNIERWNLSEKKHFEILYTHYSQDGKKKVIDLNNYPKAASYLESHREQLEGRTYVKKSGKEWFEIWVSQNPAFWSLPKIVFPDISVGARFYFDDSGCIVNGNCYWIVAEKKEQVDLLRLIQGIANSSTLSRYHDLLFNNKLYSGRRRYFSQYVENYPIPNLNHPSSKKIISIVKSLNSLEYKGPIAEAENKLNQLVSEAFNL